MTELDVRWKQRFENFKKALAQLNEADELSGQRPLSRLENQGVIQAFGFIQTGVEHAARFSCIPGSF
jgi:hypothetical protein